MIKNVLIALSIMFSLSATAAEKGLPKEEIQFIDEVSQHNKAEIHDLIGEPTNKKDVLDESGAVVASIWYYRNLNTDEKGKYYKITELDFMGEKLMNVIFSNEDVDLFAPPPVDPMKFFQEKT